jgi:hypothetical protein
VACGDVGLAGVAGVAGVVAGPGCAIGVRVEIGGGLVRNVGILESGFRKTLFGMSGGRVEIIPTIAKVFHRAGTMHSMPDLETQGDEREQLLIDLTDRLVGFGAGQFIRRITARTACTFSIPIKGCSMTWAFSVGYARHITDAVISMSG